MQIIVKCFTGYTGVNLVELDAVEASSTTVDNVKGSIQFWTGIPPSRQLLSFGVGEEALQEVELEGDWVLSDYVGGSDAVLHIFVLNANN